MDYSLADLTKVTGAKRRTVQLWAESGVIQAMPETERAGTGVHRRFSRHEAIIACLVHPFAKRQMAVGELLRVSSGLRALVSDEGPRRLFEAVIRGERRVLLVFASWSDDWEVHVLQDPSSLSGEHRQKSVEQLVSTLENLDRENSMAVCVLANKYLHGLA